MGGERISFAVSKAGAVVMAKPIAVQAIDRARKARIRLGRERLGSASGGVINVVWSVSRISSVITWRVLAQKTIPLAVL